MYLYIYTVYAIRCIYDIRYICHGNYEKSVQSYTVHSFGFCQPYTYGHSQFHAHTHTAAGCRLVLYSLHCSAAQRPLTVHAHTRKQLQARPVKLTCKTPEVVNWGNVQRCAFFALRSRPSTAPQSDWDHFCFKLKLAL